MKINAGEWLNRIILGVLVFFAYQDHKQLSTLLANPPVAPQPPAPPDPTPAPTSLAVAATVYHSDFVQHFHDVAVAGKAGQLADKAAAAAKLSVDATVLNDAINASLDKADASTWADFEAAYKALGGR